ncbi:tetraacyldisaccharide 4'-kinase [Rhodoblastus sphagnicola]|uniref:Tetraacyldisaccharide 4'-kinase n=1 Tax=Rhodoblastus sphagnicola TaxID=333368 RepID=A0A2S6N7M9_9HYPH|nr:tetraacyldisaccharide 4'-kinase [Rhodoblastus sphagnicola]MBB4196715.1 tetraacyldisaccharide 4'-kinase [Rhodoblastus sphagnicola]PPQ30611.1 tetraacyldisaccharide 4'-kinase [Rhodoblastus sphagnicola]
MRAPDFWWSANPGPFQRLIRAVLAPIAAVYGRVAVRRMNRGGARVNAPVICIGNFVAGGAGKTPTALAVAKWLKRAGETPAFLTRGYGGAMSADGGAHLVDRRRHDAAQTGDEPLLLAQVASTVVARDRPSGALLALAGGATMIVMDDGLQNPSLARDFTLAVIDGAVGFGNGRLIPAGPLRAPLALQLERTDAGLVIGEGEAGDAAEKILREAGKPVFHGRLAPDAHAALHVLGAKVVAFAGIGRPGKFFASLEGCGARIVSRHAFPDHHPYRAAEIVALQRRAAAQDALLLTTEKDMVKIAPFLPGLWQDLPLPESLPVALVVEEADALRKLLLDALSRARREQLGDRPACA